MRCEHLHDAAPYVLGALSHNERTEYQRHLAGCEFCQAEVAELAEMPLLLGKLDLSAARAIAAGGPDAMQAVLQAMPTSTDAGPKAWAGPTAVPTEGKLLPRVLDRARAQRRAERRRRRWQTAGTALVAACLAAVAIFGVRLAVAPHLDAMRAAAANVPVTASLGLQSVSDGTRVHMQCRYKEGSGNLRWSFHLVAVPKSGDAQEIASWSAGYDDQYDMIGHTDLRRSDIDRLEIRTEDDTPLLLYRP